MADFNFYLNTQGPRGPKGEKGDTGSPVTVEVYENTANSFILRITDVNGTFLTPNLRSGLIDEVASGTYLRYDPETQQVYTGDAEIATGDITGMVRFASEEELLDNESNVVISPSDLQEYLANKLVAGNNILIEPNEETGEIVFYGMGGGGSSNVATDTRVGLVKPDNTTIIVASDGTISAVGGGSGEGGTTDFNALINKPTINNETVQGDKSLDDYDIQRKMTPVTPLTFNEALSVNIRNTSYDVDGSVTATYSSNLTVSNDNLRRTNNTTLYADGYLTASSYIDIPYSFGDVIAAPQAVLGYKDNNNNFYPVYFFNSTHGYIVDNSDVSQYTSGSVTYNQFKANKGTAVNAGTMAGASSAYGYNTSIWQLNATDSGYEVLYISLTASNSNSPYIFQLNHNSDYIPLMANINTVRLLNLPLNTTSSTNLYCVRKGNGQTYRDLTVEDVAAFPKVVPDTYSQGLFLKVNKATNNSYGIVCPDGETIQLNSDGKLACNLDEIGGELNDLSGRVTALEDGTTGFEFGIKGDYSTHYGILDAPNGLLSNPAGTLDITLMPGVEMQLAGAATKTTNASEVTTTLNSTESNTVVFYVDGELLECGSVYYQMDEPTDGALSYIAWFNPNDDVNTTGQWQFKSNDTGNVWRSANATPIANITKSGTSITRIDYIGYRILDNDIYAKKDETLSTNQITNCITEIPQRIKYTLNNGTLTIKAGSVVIVPYGVEDLSATYPVGATFLNDNFKVYDTQYVNGKFFVWAELVNDISHTEAYSGDALSRMIVVKIESNTIGRCGPTVTSGATSPSEANATWYDDTNNYCKYFNSATESVYCSFCIGVVTISTGYSSVDQIFNGFGYIGQHTFVDKGVKALLPNGRNEDSTLKNIETVTTAIAITDLSGQNSILSFFDGSRFLGYGVNNYTVSDSKPTITTTQAMWYCPRENFVYSTSDSGATWTISDRIYTGLLTKTEATGSITYMTPKNTFKAVDYSEFKELSLIPNYSAGISQAVLPVSSSKFTAPDNGLYYASFSGNKNVNTLYINDLATGIIVASPDTGRDQFPVSVILKKGDVIYWSRSASILQSSVFYPFERSL